MKGYANKKEYAHVLKLDEKYFEDVEKGKKNFELRKNDRGFKIGDEILLVKSRNGEFLWSKDCSDSIEVKVKYILQEIEGLEEGYCILGIER